MLLELENVYGIFYCFYILVYKVLLILYGLGDKKLMYCNCDFFWILF